MSIKIILFNPVIFLTAKQFLPFVYILFVLTNSRIMTRMIYWKDCDWIRMFIKGKVFLGCIRNLFDENFILFDILKYIFDKVFKNGLNKICGRQSAFLLKKRLWHRYFSVNFAKFLRTLFLQNTTGRLLLSFLIFGWLLNLRINMDLNQIAKCEKLVNSYYISICTLR